MGYRILVWGEWDTILWVNVKTPSKLEKFVYDFVKQVPWVEKTHTTWGELMYNSW